MAIARWVSRDGADPKMGVLSPSMFENVDCLLWVQVSFLFFLPRHNSTLFDLHILLLMPDLVHRCPSQMMFGNTRLRRSIT